MSLHVTAENTLYWVKHQCTAGAQFYKFGFSCYTTYKKNIVSSLDKSSLDALETSCTVIFPPTVSILWLQPTFPSNYALKIWIKYWYILGTYLGSINVDEWLLLVGHRLVGFPGRWSVAAILTHNLSFASIPARSNLESSTTTINTIHNVTRLGDFERSWWQLFYKCIPITWTLFGLI